jgi:hypothetical protein
MTSSKSDVVSRRLVSLIHFRLDAGSRVRRESHARFCERPGVQFPRPTH